MLPSGQITIQQGPVFQRVERATHWINHDPLKNSINFDITYPLVMTYLVPSFKQLELGKYFQNLLVFFLYSA